MTRAPGRKVVVVNTADQGGGAERFSWLLFKGMERRGLDSWLLVGDKRTDDPRVVPLHASARFDYRPYRRWRYRAALPVLRWVERRLGLEPFRYPFSAQLLALTGPPPPDLVLCVNLHGGYFDLRQLAPLSRRVPTVLRPGDGWLLTGHCACPQDCERWLRGCGRCPDLARPPAVQRDATRVNWRRKQRIYRRSAVYAVAASRWQMDRFERSMLMPAVRGRRVIPNGVDQSVFRPGDPGEARRALGLPPDAMLGLVVAAMGARNAYKDFATLRAALRRLGEDRGGAVEVVVAGGEAPPERFGAAGLRHLPFCASPARLALLYQAADFLVHPSLEETFSFAIVEALSCGVPVVATRVGSVPEMLDEGDTGLLVPPRDPDALARTMRRLIADPALRQRLGRRGADRARRDLDVETMVDRYVSWFGEIWAGWAAPAAA